MHHGLLRRCKRMIIFNNQSQRLNKHTYLQFSCQDCPQEQIHSLVEILNCIYDRMNQTLTDLLLYLLSFI